MFDDATSKHTINIILQIVLIKHLTHSLILKKVVMCVWLRYSLTAYLSDLALISSIQSNNFNETTIFEVW